MLWIRRFVASLGLLLILALTISSGTGCGYWVNPPNLPPWRAQLIDHIRNSTVALVAQPENNVHLPYCSGAWVADNEILTAAHCVEIPLKYQDGDNTDMVGQVVQYIGYNEMNGLMVEPSAVHLGKVVKWDHDHDLLLIQALGQPDSLPPHEIAEVATETPAIGSDVYVMGMTAGLYWTFMHGYVSQYWEKFPGGNGNPVPLLQTQLPIYHGNSGGGIFTSDGKLVAIVHVMSTEDISVSLHIPVVSIRRFLAE